MIYLEIPIVIPLTSPQPENSEKLQTLNPQKEEPLISGRVVLPEGRHMGP